MVRYQGWIETSEEGRPQVMDDKDCNKATAILHRTIEEDDESTVFITLALLDCWIQDRIVCDQSRDDLIDEWKLLLQQPIIEDKPNIVEAFLHSTIFRNQTHLLRCID